MTQSPPNETQPDLQSQLSHLQSELTRYRRQSLIDKTLLQIVSLAFNTELTIESLYASVCTELNNIIDTSNFYFARVKDNGAKLSFDFYQDTYGLRFEYDHDFPVRAYGNGFTEMVIDHGDTLLLDHQQIVELIESGQIAKRQNCAQSWLAAPLIHNHRVIGAMVVQSYDEKTVFVQEDADVFRFVSPHIAAAIARHETQQALALAATTDSLTGLINRNAFLARLGSVINSDTSKNQAGVLFIDLDGFKLVNDTYGHEMGDTLLKHIAHLIKSEVREIDDVCRFGGDEFVILMRRLQDNADAIRVAERLLEHVKTPLFINGVSIQVGASIGIAFASDSSNTSESLLKKADLAMYSAKRTGKRRYAIAD